MNEPKTYTFAIQAHHEPRTPDIGELEIEVKASSAWKAQERVRRALQKLVDETPEEP